MYDVNILPADTFKVISKNVFTDYDSKIIYNLYQPIIGSIATSLYFTLKSFININNKSHYHIMSNMKINLDIINEARTKLEGIGLLKTYISNEKENIKNFVYELYSPLSVYEFISSPLLNTLLINNIGSEDYEEVINKFKNESIDLDNYQNITKSFSNVYRIEDIEINDNIDNGIERKVKNEIEIESNINLKDILELIPDELLNKKSITKDMIKTINNVAYVYKLNDESMKEIIINSIDVSHKIDKEKLSFNALNYYNFDNNGKVSNIVYQKQSDNLKSKNLDTSNKSKAIYSFENVSPYDFLASKYESGVPSKSDLKIIEYLRGELNMNPGVINVLLSYVLKTNNNKLTKAYVDTVASQWLKSHIETVGDAMEFAKKEYSKHKNIKKSSKMEASEWIGKTIDSEIASTEEQEKMKQMLKEVVGE